MPAPPAASLVAPANRSARAPSSAAPQDFASGLAAPPQRREEKLGTGHGAREWSVVNIVAFERATAYPQFTRQLEYDTYANLVRSGVIPSPAAAPARRPRPFPSNPDGEGYVPDPPYDR